MKKILLSIFAVAATFGAFAQDGSGFGAKLGMNVSSLSFSEDFEGEDTGSLTGINVGVFYDMEISESFYIQPGLSYTTRGGKQEYSEEDYSETYKYKLGYLQVPVLASYRFAIGDTSKLAINVGPTFGYAISGKCKWEDTDLGESEEGDYNLFEEEEGYESPYKRFEVGLNIGVEYQFSKYFVGVNWEKGLTNVYEDKIEGFDDYTAKNSAFTFNVGYKF